MSISNGVFTAEDGTELRLSHVITVSPLITCNGYSYYDLVYQGGHVSVKESYMLRSVFLESWRVA